MFLLCKHYSANCFSKSRCVICQVAHSKLLHLPVESPKTPLSRSKDQSKQERDTSSTINLQPNGKMNAAKGKEKGYIDEPDCSSLVPLMVLTAVKRNPESEEEQIPAFALASYQNPCLSGIRNTRLLFSSWKNNQTSTIACVRLCQFDREMVKLLIYQTFPLLKQLFHIKRAFLIRN